MGSTSTAMDNESLDKTTLTTISLLEARLLRIEQLLYGTNSDPTPHLSTDSALDSMAHLERRFANLVSRFRVYADILKLYRTHPSFFVPDPAQPPSQLDTPALRSTVLSFASSFPSTVSALTAVVHDTPIPDPALSAELSSLLPKMKGIEVTQLAQEAEIAELRARSEELVARWYEERIVRYGEFVAGVEGRVERVERGVRRVARAREGEGNAV
ncbi:hypothetical protein N0V82_003951 [Gnomoniopsis sp. IMI 355080]|nr:hypothetical protein N0V82_003951 [Gnomoniopsis sp. IMI 355080]